jgi:hypothetical protein
MAVLVGEAVPFGEVPLPQRPAVLAPLTRPAEALPGSVLLTADGEHTVVYSWERRAVRIMAASQTPGVLRVLVNGVPVETKTWWDYEQRVWESRFDPASDDAQRRGLSLSYPAQLTVTVEAEHMTGDWWLAVMPAN